MAQITLIALMNYFEFFILYTVCKGKENFSFQERFLTKTNDYGLVG